MRNFMRDYFKLLRFVKPHIGILAVAALCMMVSTIFGGVSLSMIVPLSDRVLTNKKIIIPHNVPGFVSSVVNKLNSMNPMQVLKIMAVALIVVFLIKGIALFFQNYLMNIVGQMCVRDIRNALYKKMHSLSLDFYSRKRTGELISRITNDVSMITNAISYSLTDLIYQSMQIGLFTFLVFYIYWKMALISFVIFPLILFPVVKLGKRIKKFSVQTQKSMADLNSQLAETIQGAYIVKVFCREDYEYKKFMKINQKYYKFILKSIKRIIILPPFTEFVGVLGAVAILIFAGKDVIEGKLSFGIFGLFMGALMSMIRPFKKLSAVYSANQRALAASGRIYEVLEEPVKVREKDNAVVHKEFNSHILFDKVWFKYADNEDFVLKDVNLRVNKNDVLAIVGHSGVGKSTLVSLIPRLYDPQRGKVTIDGIDLRDLTLHSLRSLISVVSQEMVIFNCTVRDNIAYGREGASFSDIVQAAKRAFAYDFIQNMPKKFDTVVGDRGFRLSGGEKQRIAIARAFLKDSSILILDEATSNLDTESEKLIQKALYELMIGKTVFVIAHRLSTIQNATKIVVMDKGRIIEEGSHGELVKDSTMYKRLYQLQFSA